MLLKWITEIQAIAQIGMTYCTDEYGKERYTRLMSIASEMASESQNIPIDKVNFAFMDERGYATPKLDVRAFIVGEKGLLLVKERSDDCWSLPGGWVDVNESASEAVEKEVMEETGYIVKTSKLLAFWDKLKHDHPPQWPHAHKCFFQCKIIGGEATTNLEVSEIKYFPITSLPKLSTDRVTASQIGKLAQIVSEQRETAFD